MRPWTVGASALFLVVSACGHAVVTPETPTRVAHEVALSQGPVACSYGDLAGCAARCTAGSLESCNNLGAHFELGTGVTPDARAARLYYAMACDGHVEVGCVNLTRLGTGAEAREPDPSPRPPPSPALSDHDLQARTATLLRGLRGLVEIGRRDLRAVRDGVVLSYAKTPDDVEEYIAAQYRKVRVQAGLYQGELARRLGEPVAPGAASIESAARIDDIEKVADALQSLAERLDWKASRGAETAH